MNNVKKLISISLFFVYSNAFASSSTSLPFGSAMQTFSDAISNQWLLYAAIVMVVVTCFMSAFGEHGEGFKRMLNIVMWLSIAFGAVRFIMAMFGAGAVF